ncbi:MAG TPA: hypothetical protein VFH99_03205 [Candidatus Saccharimonadales bacterium]|nr:hypothetical protein [Candidatus Saccharimonadales bacterium]
MDRRYLYHIWTKVRWIKPWYFLTLAVISTLICVFALRANNQHMVRLRDAVYTADKNNGDVAGTLRNLQSYVTSHMNTNLNGGPNAVYPPIQLKYTYQRLVQAQNAAAQGGNQLYTEAQHYCEQQDPVDFSGHNRVPCIEQYVQSHGGVQQSTIPDALYKFDFVSARWSPDLAGWSLLAAALCWLLFVVSQIARLWLKHSVK